ncbi:nucleotide-binding protein [Hoylesella marshii]|nr:HU family DNA-binding protein [Hoylesella marshii]
MDKQKDKPLYVAFSTQKGGAGKTTLTVLVASYLHYVKGYNVAVIDSDFPQYSIHDMRKRDIDRISKDDYYNVQLTRSVSLLPVCRVAGVRGTKSIQIMSVKYKLYQDNRSNSKFKGQWYARAVVMDAVHLEEISMEIQENTSAKQADVYAVLKELVTVMNRHLKNGDRVVLDGFGLFKVGLRTKPAATEKDFSPAKNIVGSRLNFQLKTHCTALHP